MTTYAGVIANRGNDNTNNTDETLADALGDMHRAQAPGGRRLSPPGYL